MAGAAIIAKAILGSIGGGFEGAAKPYTSGQSGVKAADTKVDFEKNKTESDNKDVSIKADALKDVSMSTKGGAQTTNKQQGINLSTAQSAFQNKDSYKQAFGGFNNNMMSNSGMTAGTASNFGSDEELKKIYGDSLSDKLIENFAKINAIDFRYTPEAQKEYSGTDVVDDKEHIGIKAQELENNPATKGTVERDINGNLEIDSRHLSAVNTAVIAELSRRVLTLEVALQELKEQK